MIYKVLKSKIRSCLVRIKFAPKNIGKNTYIASDVQFIGFKNIRIGNNCTIGQNTIFNVNNREDDSIKLNIHDNTYVGRNNFFTVGKSIEIGAYCLLGNSCSFLGSGHDLTNPLVPYLVSGTTDVSRITVGTNCWLGTNVSVIGHVTIGHGTVIGANSIVLTDIPPFSIVVGNPAKIIKRFNFELNAWVKNDVIPNSVYLDEKIYSNYLKENFGNAPIALHASSSQIGNI
jgi:acetyltransferase-like isoleucine patch superfamily enzyme